MHVQNVKLSATHLMLTNFVPSPRYLFALLKTYEKHIHYMSVCLPPCKYSSQKVFQKSHDCKLCTEIDPRLG